jgi:hypothetical protein
MEEGSNGSQKSEIGKTEVGNRKSELDGDYIE